MKRSREFPPGGYDTWKDFYKAKKEKQERKAELVLEQLSKQKEKESEEARFAKEVKNEIRGELSTLSIALPGSIMDNAQSAELRTYLAGQIARAACVFKVDEIVVYDDVGVQNSMTTKTVPSMTDDGEVHLTRRCCAQLARILQYLECPQYLRKDFFPKCQDLEYAGLLNPLDAPHHMRQQDESPFREGIVLKIPAKNGSYVNVGLLDKVKVDKVLQPGLRVTVEMLTAPCPTSKRLFGRIVSPSVPHQVTGEYWGYTVRLAKSLSAVLTECPYKDGYDVSVGTSERGDPVETVALPFYKHALIVFGGLAGLEAALEADDVLTVTNPAFLFDHYLNTCPGQGSRTIRTEEAILITLAELRSKLKPQVCMKPQNNLKSTNVQNVEEESNTKDDDNSINNLEENVEASRKSSMKSKSKRFKSEKYDGSLSSKEENDVVISTEKENFDERNESQLLVDDEFLAKFKKEKKHKPSNDIELPSTDVEKVKSKKKKKIKSNDSMNGESASNELS